MSTIVAGADVGGTKSTSVIWLDGIEVARRTGAGAALRPGRALASAANIATLVREALTTAGHLRADVLVVGAAGAGREPEASDLRRAIKSEDVAERVIVMTDIQLALESAYPDGPGIVLAAGTGSIAVARTADGTIERAGGYGWQMGDEGSGYAIGREVLQAVGRARDARGADTSLTALAQAASRAKDFPALVGWAAAASVSEVASLASAAIEAAEAGDDAARLIISTAAVSLASLATNLADRTGLSDVAMAGGLLGAESVRREVAEVLLQCGLRPRAEPVDPLQSVPRLAQTPA